MSARGGTIISVRLAARDLQALDSVPGETRSDRIRRLLHAQGLADAIRESLSRELMELRERIDAAASRAPAGQAASGVTREELVQIQRQLLDAIRRTLSESADARSTEAGALIAQVGELADERMQRVQAQIERLADALTQAMRVRR